MPHGLIQSSVLCLITQADIGYWISDDIQDIALKGSLELTLKPFLSFPPHFLLWPLSYSLFLPTRTSSCFTKLEKGDQSFPGRQAGLVGPHPIIALSIYDGNGSDSVFSHSPELARSFAQLNDLHTMGIRVPQYYLPTPFMNFHLHFYQHFQLINQIFSAIIIIFKNSYHLFNAYHMPGILLNVLLQTLILLIFIVTVLHKCYFHLTLQMGIHGLGRLPKINPISKGTKFQAQSCQHRNLRSLPSHHGPQGAGSRKRNR